MFFFQFSGEQNKINYSCEYGIEKSVPRDHQLPSLGKPRDDNRGYSGQTLLSVKVKTS